MLRNQRARSSLVVAVMIAGAVSCRSAGTPAPGSIALAPGAGVVGPGSGAAIAKADSAAAAYTPADVDFMTGMIPHHAQAIVMSRWCDSHGARADVRSLCQKIIIAQTDEIRLMRTWLAERGKPVPDSISTHHMMSMPGMAGGMMHDMLMPGMLTDQQMAALDSARGSQFDLLYLAGMIGHHGGAIAMAKDLFDQPPSAQETTVFRFASDVIADQSAEIGRMEIMLETVPR